MRKIATLVALVTAACSGHSPGLSPRAPEHLQEAPEVILVLESGGVIDWQKDRDERILDRLEECLPSALAPVCPGACSVASADGGDVLAPHVVLTVRTTYAASAHFMYGFALQVLYVIEDGAGTEELARFSFVYEPLTKVMVEEGDPVDEAMTFDSVLTADRLCDEIGSQASDVAAKQGK